MSTIDQHIAVMLYLNILRIGTTYFMTEFDALYRANAPTIEHIFQNPAQLQSILNDYGDDVPAVIIPDKDEVWIP